MAHPAPLVAPQPSLAASLKTVLGADLVAHVFTVDEDSITVTREAVAGVMVALRDSLEYQQLMEIAGVDYPDRAERFEVVYHLLSVTKNHRLRVRVSTDEATPVPTATTLWPNAGWLEREVFDLYGVIFAGNNDLRRILTDYGFEGHPFRKDFPLTGYVELRYSEEDKRVVYEPVKLAQDLRTFDFMSPWEGADYVLPGDEKAPAPPPADKPKTTEAKGQSGAGEPADSKAADKVSAAAPAKAQGAADKDAPAATDSRPAKEDGK